MSQYRACADYLERFDAECLSSLGGSPQAIDASKPLPLPNPLAGVLVLEGELDVFVVSDAGARHPVYRASRGDLVMGVGTTENAGVSLLAVGVPGTSVLTGVSLSEIASRDSSYAGAVLDRYVCGLLSLFEDRPLVGASLRISPDDRVELFPRTCLLAQGYAPVWLESEEHPLYLMGQRDIKGHTLPVGHRSWVEVDQHLIVRGLSSSELVARTDYEIVLQAFSCLLQRMLCHELDQREMAREKHQRRLREVNSQVMHEALSAMSQVASKSDLLPIGSPAAENQQEPMRYALQQLGAAIGAEAQKVDGIDPAGSNEQILSQFAEIYGLRTRTVLLRGQWWQQNAGPLLAYDEESQQPLALLYESGGYQASFHDGRRTEVSETVAESIHGEATMFYRALPHGPVSGKQLLAHASGELKSDIKRLALVTAATGLLASAVPVLAGVLIDHALPRADHGAIISVICALVLAAFACAAFEIVKGFVLLKLQSSADLHLQSALFDRLLRLPVSFFRRYASGDLADRVLGIQAIRETLSGSVLQGLLAVNYALFSLLVMFIYSWQLALVAIGLAAVSLLVTMMLSRRQLVEEELRVARRGAAEAFIVQLLTGVAKLRIAAAETRAFARWANQFTAQKTHFAKAQHWANLQEIFQSTYPVPATAILFACVMLLAEATLYASQLQFLVDPSGETGFLTTGAFVAFITAFTQLFTAMNTMVLAVTSALSAVPIFERMKPVLAAETETGSGRARPRLEGQLRVNQLKFRYTSGSALILNGLSLTIEAGEFVAIVGPSGSGKSTLVRLLLGFEEAEGGEILFDGSPIDSLDIGAVRRQIGVVPQNGHLVTGTLFTNIVGTSGLTEDAAWEAVRLAGLEEDVKALPMGMHTVVTEGVNTFSGGQRQRLMIARALVHRPSVVLMDEPTSALDNKTQEIVMHSLKRLSATRVVIAHRLSTIRSADRILVISNGQLVEQGTHDSLVNNGGVFADMAKRQLL